MNITCPTCRWRHDAELTCEQAATAAQRERTRRDTELVANTAREAGTTVAQIEDLRSQGYGLNEAAAMVRRRRLIARAQEAATVEALRDVVLEILEDK